MIKGRIIAIDYGQARIGTAVTDPMQIIAKSHTTLKSCKDPKKNAEMVLKELTDLSVVTVVVGLPLHMDGKESDMSKQVVKFIEHLKTLTEIPIKIIDERLTSVQADRILREAEMSRKKRAQKVDNLSATLILQTYLDSVA